MMFHTYSQTEPGVTGVLLQYLVHFNARITPTHSRIVLYFTEHHA